MKFKELYEMQAKLDEEIHRLHNTNYQKTMKERTMAFIVELGELANETRCFKYWSLKGPSAKEVIIEEYSDGLHFVLSLGLAIGYDTNTDYQPVIDNSNMTEAFLDVYEAAISFKNKPAFSTYKRLFELFLGLADKLGYSVEELKQAYINKNKINHQRQENAY